MARPAPILAWVACLLCFGCSGDLFEFAAGVTTASDPAVPEVFFLTNAPAGMLAAEEAAAWEWLASRDDFRGHLLQFIDLPAATLPRGSVLWWHYAAEEALPAVAVRDETMRAVRGHLMDGGGLFLTLIGATYVVPLGIESSPPDLVSRAARLADERTESAGLQARRHPLLQRTWGSALADANPARPGAVAAYTGDRWPLEGRTWAVQRDQRAVDANIKLGAEYIDPYGAPARVVTLGAHLYFAAEDNPNRAQLEQLAADALHYLGGDPTPADDAAKTDTTAPEPEPLYWDAAEATFIETERSGGTPAADVDLDRALNDIKSARSDIKVDRFSDAAAFGLATPTAALRGEQSGRVDDFTVHPRRALSNLRFGIVRPDRGITWLDEATGQHSFTARPEGAEIHYTDGETDVRLHLALDRADPALVGLLEIRSPAAVDLIVTWQANASREVPRGSGPLAAPTIGWDPGSESITWDSGDGFVATAGFGQPVASHVLGFRPELDLDAGGLREFAPARADTEDVVVIDGEPAAATADAGPAAIRDLSQVALQLRINPDRPALVNLVIAAGESSRVDVDAVRSRLLAAPASAWTTNADYYRNFLGLTSLGILAPDRDFENGFKWAKVGIESLRMSLPDDGDSIAAGFGNTAGGEGWFGPTGTIGGRGSLWAAMAADAYGDRQLAAGTLRTLARFQGLDGRIPEGIVEGVGPLDGDVGTTALYLVALDNHLRTWGDRALLDELWPSAQRAVAYLFSTDAGADGLVDGHSRRDRWNAEPGAQTPIDLAALWAAALAATERMAGYLGDSAAAATAAEAAVTVREVLNNGFWNPTDRRFNFARRTDGSFVGADTVLPAVPILFGLLDAGLANAALDAFAGSDFSRDWGVRLLGGAPEASGEPDGALQPAPVGLPSAAADVVSPIFTGWTSLAAYASDRPESGFALAMSNLQLLQEGGAGYATAAYDTRGLTRRTDVTRNAAAQAMTILPIVWGMLGIAPDAMNRSISIHPRLPAGWKDVPWIRVNVDSVRVGEAEFRLQVRRGPSTIEYRVDQWRGDRDITLNFTADVPEDLAVSPSPELSGFEFVNPAPGATGADGRPSTVSVRPIADAEPTMILTFNHEPFPRLMPPNQLVARTNQRSGGLRIIRSRYLNGGLRIAAQGLPGQQYTLSLATPWRVAGVAGVPDATVLQEEGQARITFIVPGNSARYRPLDIEVQFER